MFYFYFLQLPTHLEITLVPENETLQNIGESKLGETPNSNFVAEHTGFG